MKVTYKHLLRCVIGLAVLALPLYFVSAQSSATESTVTIVLHKLAFEEDGLPAAKPNDGVVNPFLQEPTLKQGRGLNGATFTVFDVTNRFYKLRSEGYSIEQSQQTIGQEGVPAAFAVGEPGQTAQVRGEDGIVSFTLPSRTDSGQDRVYLFKQTGSPAGEKNMSASFVVVLPVFKEHQALETIHLFPKSEEIEYQPPVLTKKVTSGRTDVGYGATLTYQLATTIPRDVASYQRYTVSDQATAELWLRRQASESETIKVLLNGQAVPQLEPKITLAEHGFQLDFKPAVLSNFIGQELTIEYQMMLQEGADLKTSFTNEARLTPGDHQPLVTKATVETGLKYFHKIDRVSQTSLSGAKFVVKNQAGEYLKQTAGQNQWVELEGTLPTAIAQQELRQLVSDKQGVLHVSGLAYGEYFLQEVTPPKGYILNQTAIPFTVVAADQQQALATALEVVNECDKTPPRPRPPTDPKKPTKPPKPDKHLPKTGMKQEHYLNYCGFLLLALSIVCLSHKIRTSTDEEEERKI